MLYKVAGVFTDAVATNSSWTDKHIRSLWGNRQSIVKIYPPCDTQDLIESNPLAASRQNHIVSIAQFRPEKNHAQQLKIFKLALPYLP